MSVLIKNGSIVRPDRRIAGDILVEDGKIARLAPPNTLTGDTVVDASGKLVFPGFIDAHTHFQMNAGQPNETADSFETGTRAAVVGGTTTILDFATQDRGDTLPHALEVWHSRADGHCACNYGFHMAITDWNPRTRADMKAMTEAGVTSYKVYLAYDALRLPDRDVYEILRAALEEGALVSAHCENGDLVNAGIAAQKELGQLSPAAHPRSRPACVEAEAVDRFLTMGECAGAPVYVVHLSTRRGLQTALAARERGQEVYLETCPQYLLLNENKYQLSGFESAKYVCSPPLRAYEDSAALWGALAGGVIDTVATDHCSFDFRGAKQLGKDDFSAIPNGMPGVETRPALMLTFGTQHGLPPELLCRVMAEQPAKLFGLYPRKGIVAEGADADLVVWDPAWRGVISAAAQTQNVDYTPFEGFAVSGRAETVLVNGEIAVKDGRLTDTSLGEYVPRTPCQRYRRV